MAYEILITEWGSDKIITLEEIKEYLQNMRSETTINVNHFMECIKNCAELPSVKVDQMKIGQFYFHRGQNGLLMCDINLRSAYTGKIHLYSIYVGNKDRMAYIMSDIGVIIANLNAEDINDKSFYYTGLNVRNIKILSDQIKYESSVCV